MIEKILQKALDRQRVDAAEAVELFSCNDILLLGNVASRIAGMANPEKVVTYIIDRNINYTNICVTDCTFCAFYRKESDADSYVHPFATLAEKIEETLAAGGRQILLQGGHNAKLGIDYFEDLFRRIKARFDIHLHALSPAEIFHISKISKITLDETLRRLREAGLDSIPGGGAEILVDRVRNVISAKKCTADQWLEVMAKAHGMGIPTTATMMFGHVESIEERVEHLIRLRTQQDETGGFTAFIPWTFQPGNSELGPQVKDKVSSWEYLKTLAICRIVLDNFDNIQSSWVTQGPKIGQMSLFYGANDMGSTMIEENVVRAAGTVYCMDETEIRRLIEDIGAKAQRRNMRYQYV
ncbi:MAG: cyclic dehypoxanthinyl futalosine synthase [Nitrospinales bacterium]